MFPGLQTSSSSRQTLSLHTWGRSVFLLNSVHKTSTLHKHVGCAHTHTLTLTHSRTHTNTNPSKHPLLRLSIPLRRHTEGDSVARLPWKPGRVYQPALPLADCGSHVFVCVCVCGEWVCTCVGVCETVKPIQGSALSCWRGGEAKNRLYVEKAYWAAPCFVSCD